MLFRTCFVGMVLLQAVCLLASGQDLSSSPNKLREWKSKTEELVLETRQAIHQKPNILWIIAEDMSPDLGCYGNEAVKTPFIDELAKRGMRFNQVHATGPACSPSRTALATGVFQTTLGAYHMRYSDLLKPTLPESIKIMPEIMRANGYFTGNIIGVSNTGTGKDDWLFKTEQKKWETKSWQELISRQPFFGQINIAESHRRFGKIDPTLRRDKLKIPLYYPDHPITRKDWAGYLSEVMTVDRRVGEILARLKSDGVDENTIVIVMSDHGRPMLRGKNWLYDSGTRIPLVIYYPESIPAPAKYKAGSVNDELISTIDLVAETILMGNGQIPKWMQGRSFLRATSVPRKRVYTAVDRIGNIDSRSRAVRTAQFKYIRNFKQPGTVVEASTYYRRATHPLYHLISLMHEKGQLDPIQQQLVRPIVEEELYDLSTDPYETKNLIGNSDYSMVRKELNSVLKRWLEQSRDLGMREDSEEIVAYFHKYGVLNSKKLKTQIAKARAEVMEFFSKTD